MIDVKKEKSSEVFRLRSSFFVSCRQPLRILPTSVARSGVPFRPSG